MTLGAVLVVAQWFFLGYFVALNLAYMALTFLAVRYIGRDDDARASLLLPRYFSGLEPPVSLLVPAYNEEATIASSIRSMLQLEYPQDGHKPGAPRGARWCARRCEPGLSCPTPQCPGGFAGEIRRQQRWPVG